MERKVNLMDAFPIYGYEDPILIAKEKGCISMALQLELPEVYTLDQAEYGRIRELWGNIIQTLGDNMLIHKQDMFFGQNYKADENRLDRDHFEYSDEMHFLDRPFLSSETYLAIHWVPRRYINSTPRSANQFLKKKRDMFMDMGLPKEYLDEKKAEEFESKVRAVVALFNESGLFKAKVIDKEGLFGKGGYYDKYLEAGANAKGTDITFKEGKIQIGHKSAQFYTLESLDQFKAEHVGPNAYYGKFQIGNNNFPVSNLFSLGLKLPYEHILNQYIYIPEKEKAMKELKKKYSRLAKYAKDTDGDANTAYRDQIGEFQNELLKGHKEMIYYHMNIMGIVSSKKELQRMGNAVEAAFKKVGIHGKENIVDRKNLFFGGIIGNGIGVSMDMFSPMSSDMAASLIYSEGNYKDPQHGVGGMRMVDRISGAPLLVSLYREPEERGWIFNRGMIIASGSGGGKTFFCNTYLSSELRDGAEVIMMENGNSYDKLVEIFGGVIVENDPENPFTFNPFVLDAYDKVEKQGVIEVSDQKKLQLQSILMLVLGDSVGNQASQLNPTVTTTINEILVDGYYHTIQKSAKYSIDFNGFYDYLVDVLDGLLKEKGIRTEVFDKNIYKLILGKYAHNGPKAYLLNANDDRIARLSRERLVYFKLQNLIENKELFPIVAFLMMDIFDKKLMDESKLAINKILGVDEAWNLFDNPIMARYFDGQSRMARKMGGQPIFISQKVDDFVKSEHIGKSLVVNSHIKALLDLREFADSFDEIKGILGLNDKQKQLILSINRDLPEERKLREVAICWKGLVKVFGVESSAQTKCIFETNPREKAKINVIHKANGNDWVVTSNIYAQQ